MLRITGLNGLSGDAVESDDVNIDYQNKLALYLLGISIRVKNSRNPAISGWLKNGESER